MGLTISAPLYLSTDEVVCAGCFYANLNNINIFTLLNRFIPDILNSIFLFLCLAK